MSTYERGNSTRRGRAAAVAVALAAVALAIVATPARATTGEVTIAGMAFTPDTVTVALTEGEEELPDAHAHVNFVMRDEGVEHTVSFDDRSVAAGSSGRLSTGQSYTVVFEEPGTFLYRCEIHPYMTGTVVVTPESTSPEGGEKGEEDDSGTSVGILVAVVALAAGTGALAFLLVRRRRVAGPQTSGARPTRSGRP